MRLKIRNGFIENEAGINIGTVVENVTIEEEKTINAGGEAIELIKEFVDSVNSGSFKPRAFSKKFESLIDKYEL